MAEIFGYPIMGGGGSDLNFKIIAVASESALPSSAAENTIAVITTTPITSYVFSSTAPTSPAEGMVWFATGTASTVGFNAIKRNGLWVYPTGCQQYVSGEWTVKEIMVYLNGAWTGLKKYLYKNGDLCTTLTGGWEQTAAFGYTATHQNSGAVTYNADNFYCAPTGSPQCAMLNPVNAVDLTDVQTVVIDATVTGNSGGQLCYIMPTKTSIGNNSSVAQIGTASAQIGVRTEYRLDVSALSGSYYLFVGALSTRQARVYQIWLE